MSAPQASADLYRLLQRYQLLLLTAGRGYWRQMATGDLDGSWARIAPQLLMITGAAQLTAATAAAQYVPAVLEQQGIDAPAEAQIRPQAFAGIAFDGRPLDTLLEGAVRQAKRAIGIGYDGGDALAMGQQWLDTALQTIVTDAARDATAAEVAVRPKVTAWVRVVNPPCCSRCAVLAGVVYKWNKPNPRHPRCDCQTLPTTDRRARDYTTDAEALARSGQITDLTADQLKRLDEGADLVKVLNESRDAWRARMAVERRNARRARYTASELRAADRREVRRAAMRTSNGLVVPANWGAASGALPDGGIQDFLSHLTSRVDAIRAMKDRGIAT